MESSEDEKSTGVADGAKSDGAVTEGNAFSRRGGRGGGSSVGGRVGRNVPRGAMHWKTKQKLARLAAEAANPSDHQEDSDEDECDATPREGATKKLRLNDSSAAVVVPEPDAATAATDAVVAAASAAAAVAAAAAEAEAEASSAAAAAAVVTAEKAAAAAATAAGHVLPGARGSRRYYPFTSLNPGAEARAGSLLLAAALLHAAGAGMVAALVDSTDASLPYYLKVAGMTPLPRPPAHRYHPLCLPLYGWARRGRPVTDALRIALPSDRYTAYARAQARAVRVMEPIDAADKLPSAEEAKQARAAPPPIDDEVLGELTDAQAVLLALQAESDARMAEALRRCVPFDLSLHAFVLF